MDFLRGVLLLLSVVFSMQVMAQEQVEKEYVGKGSEAAKEAEIYYDIEHVFTSLPPVVRVTKYASDTGLKLSVDSYEAVAYQEGKGVKEGEQLSFNKDGQLVLRNWYKNNMLNDTLIAYYNSGKIRRVEIYKDDVMTEGKVFAEDGTLLPYQPRERMPQFSGGEVAMFKYISKKIKYPKAALKDKASGTVIVNFVVGEDGVLRDVAISKGIHPALDAEAIRLIKSMPRWEPGIKEDKKIALRYYIPLRFSSNR